MFIAYKKVGETPLELLDRLRIEKLELKNEKLSYAGRLDPMAEGETLVLVGDENKDYNNNLNHDKEYEATFLIGFETDTGDILGKILNTKFENLNKSEISNLKLQTEGLKEIKKQTYPWFSGRKVKGKKLFDYFKEGNINIERPSLSVEIKKVELLNLEEINKEEIFNYIFESIQKVNGDFRQEEIIKKWRESEAFAPKKLFTFTIKIKVSSGTFIRALCEEFDFPCCLLRLKRTKIFL